VGEDANLDAMVRKSIRDYGAWPPLGPAVVAPARSPDQLRRSPPAAHSRTASRRVVRPARM